MNTAASFIRLHPISGFSKYNGAVESLRHGCTERPNIDLYLASDSSENHLPASSSATTSAVILGRNSLTMIADTSLSRIAANVIVELVDETNRTADDIMLPIAQAPSLVTNVPTPPNAIPPPALQPLPQNQDHHPQSRLRLRILKTAAGSVAVNHQVLYTNDAIVNEGDILSLQSFSYSYDYVVLIHPIADSTTRLPPENASCSEDATSTSIVPPSQAFEDATTVASMQQQLVARMAQDEFTCAICLEYQVQSTALVPCGHSFCHSCVMNPKTGKMNQKVCSVCNTRISSTIPNRAIDNCMNKLTHPDQTSSESPSILPTDDVQYYQERVQQHMLKRNGSSDFLNSPLDKRTRRWAPPITADFHVRQRPLQLDINGNISAVFVSMHDVHVRAAPAHQQPRRRRTTPSLTGATPTDAIVID
jgi:Zinc finger, C3HC4 type (RING finger)